MKWLLPLTIVLSFFHASSHNAFGSETYFIDNNRVLLYKIINWWYDCLPEDTTQPCGNLIKYTNEGNAQVEYNELDKILKLKIKGAFTEMLSISKQCEQCFGPSYLQGTWLNQKYFGNIEAVNLRSELTISNAFIINNMDKIQAQLIRDIEKDIIFVAEGIIGGLLDGKIALHQSGDFFKTCPEVSQNIEDSYPISLKIINSQTKEVLAKYSAIWEH